MLYRKNIRFWSFVFLFAVSLSTALFAQTPVSLLPHQQLPIDYLLKHDDTKGLIVNHYMGTGKTYLGIGFAESLQDKSVVILAPRFIESHWMEHLRNFPVKSQTRYKFVSYDRAPEELIGKDLTNTILIADEIHNLIRMIKSGSPEKNKTYSDLYIHLRTSYKIVALSGTPIYNDEYDLAYLANLVSGKNIMPFNEEQFRIQFTNINKGRSFWRGYVVESNIIQQGLPFMAAIATAPLGLVLGDAAVPIVLGSSLGSILAFPVINNWVMPIDSTPLRHLNVEKFRPTVSKFVSFYEMERQDLSDFPTKKIQVKEVPYNTEQFWFFLNFAEKSLANKGLSRLYKDVDKNLSENYLNLNTTILQERLSQTVGAGREIGNFDFATDEGLLEAPKFVQVLQKIRSERIPQTVVYSNYFENGSLAFAKYLDRNGLSGTYEILTPDLSPQSFAQIVNNYNKGTTKILILHPEITEGISLKATRQFHILEPVTNLTVQDQVIARAVRYQSHSQLAKSARHVDVYVWKATINGMNWQTLKLKKANWFKRYSELSDWSHFGSGITQIDKNFDKKRVSPDEQAYRRLESVNQNMISLKSIMKDNSIEVSGEQAPSLDSLMETELRDEFVFKLNPVVLPKTNFRMNWNFQQQIQAFGNIARVEKMKDSIGYTLEIEVPVWDSLATGVFFEYTRLTGPTSRIIDPLDQAGAFLRENFGDQFVFGLGGFIKPQLVIPGLEDLAFTVRIPLGVEVAIGQSAIPLVKDAADLKQFLLPGYEDISLSHLSGKFSYGFNTGAAIGVEYYPTTFAGLFVEGGYQVGYQLFPVQVDLINGNRHSTITPTWRGYLRHGANLSFGVKLTY